MINLRTDGIYVHVYDLNIKGYSTTGRDGKSRLHKYSTIDKIFDVFRYGKTMNIVYEYFVFYKKRTEETIELYHSLLGNIELSQLLEKFSSRQFFFRDNHNLINYTIEGNTIVFLDKDKNKSVVSFNSDTSELFYRYVSKSNGEIVEDSYRFYQSF